ncbi:MAG: hypothetical protein AAF797_01555 [Planctomycetota bacterium]
MALRAFLDENSKVVSIVMVVVCGIGVTLTFMYLLRDRGIGFDEPKWMYDLNTQQLVVAEAGTPSPSETESGLFDYPGLGQAGALVDAFVVTCGDPTEIREGMTLTELEEVGARLAFIIRANENVPTGEDVLTAPGKQLVSSADGLEWHSRMSEAGIKLNSDAYVPCEDGKSPVRTRP